MNWLRAQPGDTWQDRWLASGAESHPDWRDLVGTARPGGTQASPTRRLPHLAPGLLVLICADVIRPSVGWLLGSPRRDAAWPSRWPAPVTASHSPSSPDVRHRPVGLQAGQQAMTRIAVIMAAKGGVVGDVSVGDCLELLEAARSHGQGDGHAHSPLFYQLLHARGGSARTLPRRSRCSPAAAGPDASS